MTSIVLFHSVFGLRPVELCAAEMMRSAGHSVFTPDLYEGRVADTIEEGMELMGDIGWDRICQRARVSLACIPETAVLAGVSMGCGVVGAVWPERQQTKGVVLMHATAMIPGEIELHGLRIQLHIGEQDRLWPQEELTKWETQAEQAGMAVEMFLYRGAGHFYTDRSLAEHDAPAADLTWTRAMKFIAEA